MTKIQSSKHGFRKLEFRISNLFRISIFEFRILTQRGVALYLAIMVMSTLLAIALGINSIFLGQTKTIRAMGHSVLAFYAADAGTEAILMQRDNPPISLSNYLDLNDNGVQDDDDSSYQVFVIQGGVSGCSTNYYYCITSVGTYKETKRAIEITY